ncbi:cupin domain-containing protein [Streptomyces sp. NPDC005538]|uniref:cupin domain-containing protein n=1 Tax=unclassified Streptomyces TaxID=2593676 RepID=UPI0033AB0DD9
MRVPDGGVPPQHRHDFKEMFTILEGETEFTFRGETHRMGRIHDQHIGDAVAGKDAPPPHLSPDQLAERRRHAPELAPTYRSEFL